METQHVFTRKQRRNFLHLIGGRPSNYFHFLVFGQVINNHIEHETIQLRFRQWIGTFHLDRILSSQYEKGLGQQVPRSGNRDLIFLHSLQQGRLSLGRRTIDFVSQNHVGEDRPP